MYRMAPLKKWTKKRRNVQKSDVVLIEDSNALRGHWTNGRVKECFPGRDIPVRDVEVEIVNAQTNLSTPNKLTADRLRWKR